MKYLLIYIILIVIALYSIPEKYVPNRGYYRYGSIDTNPARRVSGPFDTCSPEDLEGCVLNNPYEGLPLP